MKIDQARLKAIRTLPPEELISTAEAAALLGVTKRTMLNRRKEGRKPPYIPADKEPVGNRGYTTSPVRYRKGDVDDLLLPFERIIHAFLVNDQGQIIGQPGAEFDWEQVTVGPINDLLWEEQWLDRDTLDQAMRIAIEEAQEAGREALAHHERALIAAEVGI